MLIKFDNRNDLSWNKIFITKLNKCHNLPNMRLLVLSQYNRCGELELESTCSGLLDVTTAKLIVENLNTFIREAEQV